MNIASRHKFLDDWLAKALVYYQIIDESLLDELAQRFVNEEYFTDVMIKNKYLSAEDIALFIENALKIPTMNLEKVSFDTQVFEKIPEETCRKYLLIPVRATNKEISIACVNPSNLDAENEIEYLTGKYVKTFFAFRDQIVQKISEYYSPDKIIDSLVSPEKSRSTIKIPGEEATMGNSPVVKLVNQIFADAVDGEASDIHIEPKENGVSVRLRIDGVLRSILELPRSVHSTLISRIKILSGLNIAESRKPQDGKAKIYVDDTDIDLRISVLPASFGEKVVIRILDKRKAGVSFDQLGIRGHNRDSLEKCFEYKQGMVLVTGPTGSGKSTTLYAAINRVRSIANNILTIEDPIEYVMEGINQVQVNEKAGITFATALRSFLRQDPDVILVGEIRDVETAEIAIQAALTGHLVLSTLHTNDTFGTITRLQDMGVDKFKITESLQGIIAQRLVRKLCPSCKAPVPVNEVDNQLRQLIKQLGFQMNVHQPKGCQKCGYTGYKGRIGVYEILLLDDALKDMIVNDMPIGKLRATARSKGFRNLFEDALNLISEGITDYNEILRVIHPSSGEQKGTEQVMESSPVPTRIEEKPVSAPPVKVTQVRAETQIPAKPAVETPVRETAPPEKHSETKDILVVEDYKTTRLLLKKMIEKEPNWKVREAEDGVQALEAIQKHHPDIILLDLMMPNMDGYEFLQHLRADKTAKTIPVLILTSLKTVENEIKGFEFGADDYLTKPINMELLVARIKRHLGKYVSSTSNAPLVAPMPKKAGGAENASQLKLVE